MSNGPLAGIRVIELVSIGPGPAGFASMLLADMGAEVLRVHRPSRRKADHDAQELAVDLPARGRASATLDLKGSTAREAILRAVSLVDVFLEGYRPGVAERLGLGPDPCMRINPRLVYGRMTGWGQSGPLAGAAGHDINYLALSGALSAFGPRDAPPIPPADLLGDFGGGGMFLAFGVACALHETAASGLGQVIDASIIDGTALLTCGLQALRAKSLWREARGSNLVDGGAPFYRAYETADGKYISVGAIESRFYRELVRRIGLDETAAESELDREIWPDLHKALTEVFLRRTRDEWCSLLEGSDACFAPVLTLDEAPNHPHNVARQVFVRDPQGTATPGAAPRFSRTPGRADTGEGDAGELMERWGVSREDLNVLRGGSNESRRSRRE